MLQHPQAIIQQPHWRRQLAQAIKTPRELLEQLELPSDLVRYETATDFPLRVPQSFVARMRKGDINDPLLRQVLPLNEEMVTQTGFSLDPVGDLAAVNGPGVLQKYNGRALVLASAACGIHCRYCFRRHFPYGELSSRRTQWSEIAKNIAADTSLTEIILSGGDPLSLDDAPLKELLERIGAIPHIKRIRFHSRFPVILPQRIDDSFLQTIRTGDTQKVFVIHSNHYNEICSDVEKALRALSAQGVKLLNQSVLLKGVNDNVDALVTLSERLFECGVTPYYLHMLDKVQGAAHFEVSEAKAKLLMEEMRRTTSGYLVPRLVREKAGVPYKLPI
ncbi:EF-P beta-lysylation protein EpmB [Pseudomonadota bacterium]